MKRAKTVAEVAVGSTIGRLAKIVIWGFYLVGNYFSVLGNGPRFAHDGNDLCGL